MDISEKISKKTHKRRVCLRDNSQLFASCETDKNTSNSNENPIVTNDGLRMDDELRIDSFKLDDNEEDKTIEVHKKTHTKTITSKTIRSGPSKKHNGLIITV